MSLKIVALIIFFLFLILPLAIRILFLTRGYNSIGLKSRISAKLDKFRARKKVFYSALALYYLLFLFGIVWSLSELIGIGHVFNLSLMEMFVAWVLTMFWTGGFYLFIVVYLRGKLKKYPRPKIDHSSKNYLIWENTFSDNVFTLRNFLLYLLIAVAWVLLLIPTIMIINHFIH